MPPVGKFKTATQRGFNSYAAGIKRYGASGSSAATRGTPDMSGYNKRDRENEAKRQAILRRLQGRR